MTDSALRDLQRRVAADPTDRQAVRTLAKFYERSGDEPFASVFLLHSSDGSHPLPFSSEAKAREVMAWVLTNEGHPGDSWTIEECELDAFAPMDHPNRPGKQILSSPRVREVARDGIPLLTCISCGSSTHMRTGVCAACRTARGMFEAGLATARALAAQGEFARALAIFREPAFATVARGFLVEHARAHEEISEAWAAARSAP